jgi:hypothetical protein
MMSSFHRGIALQAWAHENALMPSIPAPDDWPNQWRRPTGGLLPLWHGDYSMGLSAIFAAVNGLRLVSADQCELTKRDEQNLLESAWQWRMDRGGVLPHRGVRQGEWLRMVEGLCLVFARRHGQFIRVMQPWREDSPTWDEFFSAVERLLVGQHVILSLFAGAHYSVVRGYTQSSLLLFDSAEQCWVKRTCIRLVGSSVGAKHRIAPTSTLTLRRSI